MLRRNLDNNKYVLEGECGQSLTSFLEKIIEISIQNNSEISGVFNDYEFIVNQAKNPATVESLRTEYREYNKQQDEIYKNSIQGKITEMEITQSIKNSQEKADLLISHLETLDFGDFGAVLDWMCLFQNESDHTGVIYNKDLVIEKFTSNGYQIGVNTGEKFNAENHENVCKYIIGQALDGIDRIGSPHQIIHKFANDWKVKFSVAA
jgi:hypothetical protein